MIIKLSCLIYDKEKVIVVGLRSPYDILKLKNCKSYVCIFETTKKHYIP